ncbi:hypothetical protein HPB49_025756 [Dermacentor silvarum]|nr:hypothetical protein HPB49_025756 [Dermacentor silvarum]
MAVSASFISSVHAIKKTQRCPILNQDPQAWCRADYLRRHVSCQYSEALFLLHCPSAFGDRFVLLAAVRTHNVMMPDIAQSCSDTELEPAAPHHVSIDLNADCEINEPANASGQVKPDAQSQCIIEVYSKATQTALKATTTKSAKVQASRTVKEVACQTDLELPDVLLMEEMRQRCSTPLCSEPSMTYEDNTHGKTYEPTLNSSVASSGEPPAARKFIVYEECLLQVFQACKTCGLPAEPSLQVKGSLVTASVICQEKHVNIWHSQPKKGLRALDDITLAAAILFTGCSTAQSLRFLKNAGVACFSERTYHRLQSTLLLPAVNEVWQDEKRRLTQTVVSCGGAAKVAGDSRAYSPGYSAKYGVYSMLEINLNRIIHIELVQCNEVSSSTHMELEGLKRALASLDESGVNVTEAVTDRHPQVRRYFKSERPEVDHLFDAWHVCKGLDKKLLQAAKSTGCIAIGLWTRSIVNHLYFSVQCGNGNGDLAVAVTALAALHYNENADKGQAVTLSGELRWKVKHPKARNGEASVSSIKQEPTYASPIKVLIVLNTEHTHPIKKVCHGIQTSTNSDLKEDTFSP